tara:strand:- start:597 stop:1112 length:516 start_codon:yes stop_codon:yes gene_type:complete
MKKKELTEFFDENMENIFSLDSSELFEALSESVKDPKVKKALKAWPSDVKKTIAEKYLLALESDGLENILASSWSEYYEMYDGKFDEKHMLHISIDAHYKEQVEELGYKKQKEEDDWHKPEAGEYKIDDEGHLIIIHSCPDREIFEIELNQYLEDLSINESWVIEISLTII